MLGLDCIAVQDVTKLEDMVSELQQADVIFLDLEMPKIDGYEMLDILKNNIGTTAPIVACTVHLNEINTARDLGFHSFIGKPIKADRFPDQLERILNNEPVWEAR
jgi:two-component system cell cycle response regulator DivK